MADIQHSAMTDPSLHEPKGVSTALAETVYVADGAGSGDWTYQKPSNVVVVSTASDFPAAVATVRTLADDTTYHIVGSVDIGGDTLVCGSNTVIRGNTQDTDQISSSTSGTLITASSNSFRLYKVGFTCTSGSFMAVSGASSDHTLREVDVTCDTFGTVAGNRTTDIWRSNISCATTGLTFSGSCFEFSMENSSTTVTTASGICFDFGVATFSYIRILDVVINNAASVTGLDIATSGANLNSGGLGFIVRVTFQTSASATAGYTQGDIKWVVSANTGLANNPAAGQGYIESSALSTTFSGTGVGNDVAANFGAAWTSGIARKFTASTAGVYTYTATVPIDVLVNCNIFASISGGASRTYNWYVAKNATIVTSSVSKRTYDGTNAGSVSVASIVSLVTGDTISLRVRAETATTAIVANTVSMKIIQLGA